MVKALHKVHSETPAKEGNVIPLFGKDEMNLVEFPFGPVTQSTGKTMEVEHEVFDKTLKREVSRRLIITGADAFGLPRPIDDQVLIGMKALTYEAGQQSRSVQFSRYQLCRVIGWEPDGRAYQRLEESFDRIAGTTLKFKDAWWDKGEKEWKSKTFHLIEDVNLCSRDELDRKRLKTGHTAQKLCSFTWSDVVWKSFQDGFIKTLDMELFRRIANGKRKEVSLRLFRILDFIMETQPN
jgi:plasmid replication initiation protein